MEFNSVIFIVFFLPISIIAYYLTPVKYKSHSMLIISSVYCGMISIYLLALTYILITFNYYISLMIEKNLKNIPKKKILFILSLIFNITAFIILKKISVLKFIMPMHIQNTFMPICISFFMLQFIGYIIDVYKREVFAEKNYINFALYILFFPKFIMGPVVNYREFYSFLKLPKINLSILGKGFTLFSKGLFKNVFMSSVIYPLYQTVDNINIEKLSSLSVLLGILAFSLSFYFCLSGMLDMALGLSYCFGYKFQQDFNHPLFSSGLSEFFSRWHISIVKWFEKYIKPIKSKSINKYSEFVMIILVWALVGIWYEMSWNKLIWGIITGISISVEKIIKKKNSFSYLSIIYTFAITSIGWIFFSQSSVNDSVLFIKALIGGNKKFADTLSFHLFKSYIVTLLISIYASTDLFKNLIDKIKDNKYLSISCNAVMPFVDFIFIIISLAVITANSPDSFSLMFG